VLFSESEITQGSDAYWNDNSSAHNTEGVMAIMETIVAGGINVFSIPALVNQLGRTATGNKQALAPLETENWRGLLKWLN
jgi:hypothetical protein